VADLQPPTQASGEITKPVDADVGELSNISLDISLPDMKPPSPQALDADIKQDDVPDGGSLPPPSPLPSPV